MTRCKCGDCQRSYGPRGGKHAGYEGGRPTRPTAHGIEIGARVRVLVDDDRGCRWYPAKVTGHTRAGTANRDGGWPTYAVETDDGHTFTTAAPECVRAGGRIR